MNFEGNLVKNDHELFYSFISLVNIYVMTVYFLSFIWKLQHFGQAVS